MKFNIRSATALLSAVGLTLLSGSAFATNGYFTHGVGTESKGMAGTGVGSNAANGPIIVASNPALGVFASDNWEAGISAFSPRRSIKANAGFQGNFGAFSTEAGRFNSSSEWFPIPYLAKNWRMSNDNAISLVFYGRGGMNTDWDDARHNAYFDPTGQGGVGVRFPGVFGGGEAGVDLSQAFLAINYAGKSGDTFAWGIGPVFAFQRFEAKGLASFAPYTKSFIEVLGATGMPSMPDSLTNNGHDSSTGFGAAAGIWWAMGDVASAGISYQSKISMSEFKHYADLFAESGGFDIPSSAKIGLSFAGSNDVRFNIDVEHTMYSEVASVGNSMSNIFGCPAVGGTDIESCLGGANGAGFGWDDMTTYKLGIEWAAADNTTYRFGYSYGDQPIHGDDVLFNILAPGVVEQHFTFGMSRSKPNGGQWNYSLMFAPSKKVTGISAFDPGQEITLEMSQVELEVSFLW